jgi:hypothetical protein
LAEALDGGDVELELADAHMRMPNCLKKRLNDGMIEEFRNGNLK